MSFNEHTRLCNISKIKIQDIFIILRSSFMPLHIQFSHLWPRHPVLCFTSLLFLEFHLKWMLPYVVICVWVFFTWRIVSRFVLWYNIRGLLVFLRRSFPLCGWSAFIHAAPGDGLGAVPDLGLLCVMLLWTFMCRLLCGHVFVSLGKRPRNAIAGLSSKYSFNPTRECPTAFPSGCTIFHPKQQWMRISLWSLILSWGPSDCETQVLSPRCTRHIPKSEHMCQSSREKY